LANQSTISKKGVELFRYPLTDIESFPVQRRIAAMKLQKVFGLLLSGALSTSVSVVASQSSQAGWPEYKQECHIDKLRNNAWPQPFRSQDAAAVVAPFEVMKANGWREFNTIPEAFFDGEQQLTDAGMLKVSEVLTHSPPNRKAIFVVRSGSPEQTAARIESVEIAVSGLIPVGDLPPIHLTDIPPGTSSGTYQTIVNRALVKTTPTPRLPQFKSLNAPSQTSVAPNAGQPSGK
jgi:hypothetical protein